MLFLALAIMMLISSIRYNDWHYCLSVDGSLCRRLIFCCLQNGSRFKSLGKDIILHLIESGQQDQALVKLLPVLLFINCDKPVFESLRFLLRFIVFLWLATVATDVGGPWHQSWLRWGPSRSTEVITFLKTYLNHRIKVMACI